MIKICDEWYFKNDGSQYILIRQYEKEKMKFGTKESTGEMRTVTEEVGYFNTLQFMLKKLAKIILAKEEIDSLGAYIDRLEQLEEKLCEICKGH